MNIKRITAIVPITCLTTLERNLRSCGVPGVTVERVQGYGEHPNYFRRDLMQDNARLILFTQEERVDEIVKAICECAYECGYSGLLAVEHIERLLKLPNGEGVNSNDLTDTGAAL